MKVVYMAHPVAGDVVNNLARAKRWVRFLEEKYDVAIVASWITECEIWDDAVPEQREAGMQRNLAVIERCDELWLVGGRVSSGMQREAEFAKNYGLPVLDMTTLGEEPPK